MSLAPFALPASVTSFLFPSTARSRFRGDGDAEVEEATMSNVTPPLTLLRVSMNVWARRGIMACAVAIAGKVFVEGRLLLFVTARWRRRT